MTGTRLLGLLAATMLVGACATTASAGSDVLATATLLSAEGAARGTATLVDKDGKVELRLVAEGLTGGVHGAHLHAVGSCQAPGFTSAGPHLNPHDRMHGADNPQGSHLGDLPNLTTGSDGRGTLASVLPGSRVELEAQLFDGDGTAVVVHDGPDDYRSDPAGNSGARIACGVLKRG